MSLSSELTDYLELKLPFTFIACSSKLVNLYYIYNHFHNTFENSDFLRFILPFYSFYLHLIFCIKRGDYPAFHFESDFSNLPLLAFRYFNYSITYCFYFYSRLGILGNTFLTYGIFLPYFSPYCLSLKVYRI